MERLFGSLSAILHELGKNTVVEEQLVFAAWKRVAGEQLNNRTKPLEFFENRLIVAVENDIWRTHLVSLAPEMIARLNTVLGESSVKFIEFRVEPLAMRKIPIEPQKDESAANLPGSLTIAAEMIADPQLRKSFINAAASCLMR